MLPPLDADTVLYFAIGAAGMAALDTLVLAWRDRERLMHRWRNRNEPVPEPFDENRYLPDAVTDEERRAFARTTFVGALFAGAGLAGYMQGSMLFVLALAIVSGVFLLLRALFEDGAARVEVGEGAREEITLGDRLTKVGAHLVALLTLAVFAFESPDFAQVRMDWGIGDGIPSIAAVGVGLLVGGWHLFEAWRAEPDGPEGYTSPYGSHREDIQRTAVALIVVLALIAGAALAFA